MILVDTSVWAAYFNGEDRPEVVLLDRILEEDESEIVIIPIVLTEILQGFRTESGFRRASGILGRLTCLDLSVDTHVRAARLYRSLRGKGVTIRGTMDCIIAQACIDTRADLLTLDRHFEMIARHARLPLLRV